jgi:hypothetical protein
VHLHCHAGCDQRNMIAAVRAQCPGNILA